MRLRVVMTTKVERRAPSRREVCEIELDEADELQTAQAVVYLVRAQHPSIATRCAYIYNIEVWTIPQMLFAESKVR